MSHSTTHHETTDTPRFSFVRNLRAADGLTFANGLGGAASILATLGYVADPRPARLLVALAFFPFCLAMDFFDGRVARARAEHSPFGGELDSLADAVAFGVAPAVAGWAAGLRGAADVVALLFFVGCAIGRLARYGATAGELADQNGKVRYFEGVPVTGSGLLVATLALCALTDRLGDRLPLGASALGPISWHPIALAYVAVGMAMISKRLRVPKP
jgi:CDP-diacylglycerol---serine O-phosphatidyltransferase